MHTTEALILILITYVWADNTCFISDFAFIFVFEFDRHVFFSKNVLDSFYICFEIFSLLFI